MASQKTYALTQESGHPQIKLRYIGSHGGPHSRISRSYLPLPGSSWTVQHITYSPQRTHHSMNQNQFYNQTHFDSTVSSTEGLVPQAANCLNGQAETVATGGVHGTGEVPEQYDRSFGQHNENSHYIFGKFSGFCHRYNHLRGLYATGTKVVPSDDPYSALQNQGIQTYTFGSSNPSVHTLQGGQGIEEVVRQIHYVYGLPSTFYPSSAGAHCPDEVDVPPGPVAVSAPMGVPARTCNRTSPKQHFDFNIQGGSTFTLPNGLVPLSQASASNMYAGQTAFSSSVYPTSYYEPCATCPDISVFGPRAQTAAPRMNTVTPFVVYCNDRGGAFVGAAACGIAPSPGPTPNINHDVNKIRPMSTASTCIPRGAENGGHENPQKTHAPRATGSNRMRRSTPAPRGVPLSRTQAAKSPSVQYEKDINTLAARLLNDGAHPATVEVLRAQVFNNGVTERALMAKFIHKERVNRKYRLLLEHSSVGYCCLLCPQECRVKYKNPQDSLRHLRKDHFGLVLICHCGW